MELESVFEVFIAVIVIIGSMIASARKASSRRVEAASRRPVPGTAAPASAPAPAQPVIRPSMSFSDVPGQVITPTVHTHLQPDCDVHDASGSLGFVSTEGKDPCHDDQLTHERTTEAPAPAEGGLTLDWSGESMVKAFIMQEVLTRPAQRRAGQHN